MEEVPDIILYDDINAIAVNQESQGANVDLEVPNIKEQGDTDNDGNDGFQPPKVEKYLKRRGKAIEWKFVRKYDSIEAALEKYTKSQLTDNEQIRGRKSFGKSNAYYYNCQKMSCGCKKKWRLITLAGSVEAFEEETYEDHSCHELFARNGGFGMAFDQVQLINEAIARCPMKPLQILKYFEQKEIEASKTGTSNSCKLCVSS